VKLFESPEFRDAIQAAKDHFGYAGLTEQLIEKDYYVTEALRIVAERWPTQVIFKGGTSLSKGWKIIDRFSEDIDLFLNRAAFEPPLGSNRVDRKLKAIRDAVSNHPGLTYTSNGGFSDRGVARKDYFEYQQTFSGIASIANRILLEAGTRSGDYPLEKVKLSSYLAEFLQTIGESLGADDESPFFMQLLDYRRTFVEKLFTIQSKVEQSLQEGTSIGTYARHYYDLYCLAQQDSVKALLENTEFFSEIKQDCDRISKEHFAKSHLPPKDLAFSTSQALFPQGDLRKKLQKDYETQCQSLCYGEFPSWSTVETCFEAMREKL
jgi:hypothetical protein